MKKAALLLLLCALCPYVYSQQLPQALSLTDEIEAELRTWKTQIEASQNNMRLLMNDYETQTGNLNLLLDDYLKLEGSYQQLSDSLTNRLGELTAQYRKSESSAKFWKICSIVLAPVAALSCALLVAGAVF
jgi:hypothetical protein